MVVPPGGGPRRTAFPGQARQVNERSGTMNPMDGKLILPTNWDPEYLAKILPFKPAYLYGSLPQERTLRTYTLLQEIGPEDAAGHISTARNNGTGFTYVMNATCL